MDKLLAKLDKWEHKGISYIESRGIAYQSKFKNLERYEDKYFDKYLKYEGTEIGRALNNARLELVNEFLSKIPYKVNEPLLDIGIGSGAFIKARGGKTFGYDICNKAFRWLEAEGKLAQVGPEFRAYTMWDTLEHVPVPSIYLDNIPRDSLLFVSIPIIGDIKNIPGWKHHRPGEHLYYFTKQGFKFYMEQYGFRCLKVTDIETQAGREDILSFVFKKNWPDYHDTIMQYKKLHTGAYGTSAMLYFDQIAMNVLDRNPKSILDYGTGRSDLVAHFWKDGERTIAKYDPAIPEYKIMPKGLFDLVICCDVMEHIPMHDVDRIFGEIKRKSHDVIFTISMKPARAELPDGRNAHITLLTRTEWLGWIRNWFTTVREIPTQWDHILMVRTF